MLLQSTWFHSLSTYFPSLSKVNILICCSGRTHGSRYSLYKVGEMCSESIKQFSELGTTDLLDKEMQGANDIFDLFTLPRIYNEGVGSTSGRIFLNGKHPEVRAAQSWCLYSQTLLIRTSLIRIPRYSDVNLWKQAVVSPPPRVLLIWTIQNLDDF